MREGRKWLHLLMAGLLACTLALAGCSGDDGSDGRDGQDFQLPEAQQAGILACSTCHGTSSAASEWVGSKHAMNSSHTVGSCATECHNPSGAMFDMSAAFGVSPTGTVVGCEDCHGAGSNHANLPMQEGVANTQPGTAVCAQCHNGTQHASRHVFASEIASRFETSRHANQSARSGFCSACHSHEGGIQLLAMGRQTSLSDLQNAYNADTASAYLLPVGSDTIDGVMKKSCATCHDPHTTGLRGDGEVLASAATVTGFPVEAGTAVDGEVRVAYSAEFNLCTACHAVDLNATWDATAGYNGRGMVTYELSEAYSAANLIDADSGTFNLGVILYDANGDTITDANGDPMRTADNKVFYHDGASGNGRTMVDTHFGGQILSHLVDFAGGNSDIEIKGYNINAGATNACTICHDPHTGGKMLSVQEGQGDNIDNQAISYAEGLGDFHTGYTKDTFSRNQTGASCVPCHTGDKFVEYTTRGAAANGDQRWNVIGCRSCHDLAQPNAAPGNNNAEAFAAVREFQAGHEFTFDSGVVVDVADLGVNQICFECHKGRSGVKATADTTTLVYDVSYFHYAPSMAILFGDESKMVPTYEGKTYAGKFVHGGGAVNGVSEFGCVDCHNVHSTDGNDVVQNKMATSADCAGCHQGGAFVDANVLRDRTVAYGQRLHDTILAEYNTRFEPDITAEQLHTIIAARAAGSEIGANDLAYAASIYKIFNYEDGSPTGTEHGHGGSWAHNSRFARQVQFDAIEALGGDLTGLTRP